MSDQSEDAQKAYKKAREHGLQDLFTTLTPPILLPPHSSTTTANNNNDNNNSSNIIRGMKRAAPV